MARKRSKESERGEGRRRKRRRKEEEEGDDVSSEVGQRSAFNQTDKKRPIRERLKEDAGVRRKKKV